MSGEHSSASHATAKSSSERNLAAPQHLSEGAFAVRVNGQSVTVSRGTVAAAAIALAGMVRFRSSVQGEARGPLCGMGICMECRATINGRPLCRTCVIECEPNMEIETDCDTALTSASEQPTGMRSSCITGPASSQR
jgi:hypothetical protein